MFKKLLILNIITVILLSFNSYIFADDEIDNTKIEDIDKVIQTASEASEIPKINSRYSLVLDRNSKAILYGKNETTKTKMASTTKIMSSLVVIENSNLNDIVEISSKAAGTGGSRLKIKKGDKITVKDLLYGLMLRSGNDAAVALAEHVGGSIEGFAELMNKKAIELGLENTHFVTPHGLDSEEHYTTPYELAILTDYALNNEVFSNIVKTKTCNISVNGISRTISNTNELLGNLNGVYGVKTGFTNGGGRCLVTSIKRGNLDIVCVVLGADTKKIRTTDSVKLIEYTFNNFENIDAKAKIEEEFNNWKKINEGRIFIEKGIKDGINLKLEEYNLESYPIKKGTENNLQVQIDANLNLKAPVEINTKIGEVTFLYNNHIILKINILTAEAVKKKGIKDYILEITRNYGNYLEEVTQKGQTPLG